MSLLRFVFSTKCRFYVLSCSTFCLSTFCPFYVLSCSTFCRVYVLSFYVSSFYVLSYFAVFWGITNSSSLLIITCVLGSPVGPRVSVVSEVSEEDRRSVSAEHQEQPSPTLDLAEVERSIQEAAAGTINLSTISRALSEASLSSDPQHFVNMILGCLKKQGAGNGNHPTTSTDDIFNFCISGCVLQILIRTIGNLDLHVGCGLRSWVLKKKKKASQN